MLTPFKNNGFSIVEVVVASVIFAIAATGIFSTLTMTRKPAAVTERKIVAANYGRMILEDFRSKIDARPGNWNGGPLGDSGSAWPQNFGLGTTLLDGIVYAAGYQVTNETAALGGGSEIRKVSLTITWTEP